MDVEVELAVLVILVALMVQHARLHTLTLLAVQPLKTRIALVEWHRLQHHRRDQPHRVQFRCHLQLLPLFRRRPLPLLRCPAVVQVARSVATHCAPMEIIALEASVVWMGRLAHLHQPTSMRVSIPRQPTALDDQQLHVHLQQYGIGTGVICLQMVMYTINHFHVWKTRNSLLIV